MRWQQTGNPTSSTLMRRPVLASLLVAVALCGLIERTHAAEVRLTGDAKAAGEVWASFRSWTEAYDKGDLTQIMAIFDRGVVFAFQGGKDQSYEDLRHGYEDDLKSRLPGTTWVPSVEEVYADENLAFVRAIWELHVTNATAQVQVKARNRSLDVLRKVDGQWRIFRSINYPEKQ
jgi:uncharacterized protein (TIGR02246 family)